jgi:hypothetical protein
MKRKRVNAYPSYFVDYVVEVYRQTGQAEAVRLTGMGSSTICLWARKRGVVTEMGQPESLEKARAGMASKRAQMRTVLFDKLEEILKAIKAESPHDARDLAWVYGVLLDKFRLEAGEVTGRQEIITPDQVDAEIARLEAQLAQND